MDYLVLSVIGLISGLLGAMLGLGGSVILIPALNEVYGVRQHPHQAAAMILNFVVVSAATWGHTRVGAVMPSVVKATIPAAIVGVIIGVQVSELPFFAEDNDRYLAAVFGLFMLGVAGFNLRELRLDGPRELAVAADAAPPATWKAALAVGLPTGFVSGLLGVGGGLVAVPSQQIILGIPLLSAIANSAATTCGLSVVGAVSKNYQWWSSHPNEGFGPLVIALGLLPASLGGSLIGSRLAHALPVQRIRRTYILLLTLVGIRQLSHLLG